MKAGVCREDAKIGLSLRPVKRFWTSILFFLQTKRHWVWYNSCSRSYQSLPRSKTCTFISVNWLLWQARPWNFFRFGDTKENVVMWSHQGSLINNLCLSSLNHSSIKPLRLAVRHWTPKLGLKTSVLDDDEDREEISDSIHWQVTHKLLENGLKPDYMK